MGLTIHWNFKGPKAKTEATAIIEKMRQRAFLAGAQTDVEDAVDGRGVHLDANPRRARDRIRDLFRGARRRADRIRG